MSQRVVPVYRYIQLSLKAQMVARIEWREEHDCNITLTAEEVEAAIDAEDLEFYEDGTAA